MVTVRKSEPQRPARRKIDWTNATGWAVRGAYGLTTLVCIGSLALWCMLLPFGLTGTSEYDPGPLIYVHIFTYGAYCVVGLFHVLWCFLTGKYLNDLI